MLLFFDKIVTIFNATIDVSRLHLEGVDEAFHAAMRHSNLTRTLIVELRRKC